jgi:hypothetical protein
VRLGDLDFLFGERERLLGDRFFFEEVRLGDFDRDFLLGDFRFGIADGPSISSISALDLNKE